MDEQGLTDAELVAMIRQTGDQLAIESLVRRHTGRVRSMVYPLVLNDADADDVTQEALLRALNGLAGFRAESSFTTWLHRVAVNTARNFLRSRNRRLRLWTSEAVPEDVADAAFRTPARSAEAVELDHTIAHAMQELPDEQRIALSLVVIQQLDEKEAAQVAGCGHATLRWRVHRARCRMRHLLKDAKL